MRKLSNVLLQYSCALCSKHTRALIFQNLCQAAFLFYCDYLIGVVEVLLMCCLCVVSGCFLAGLAEDGLFVLRRTFGQHILVVYYLTSVQIGQFLGLF